MGFEDSTLKRRDFVKLLGLGGLGLSLGGCGPLMGAANRGGPRKPNFIVIMADDLGYGDIGCYGNTEIRTPNLDALASGGMRFTDYHSNSAVCSPTRAALLTGRYQQRCGMEDVIWAWGDARKTGMPLKEITFAEVLANAGYRTDIFGKWHLGYLEDFNPVRQGFDRFVGFVSGNIDYHSHIDNQGIADWWWNDKKRPEPGYLTDLITDHGVRFIEDNRNHPFCLYLPHHVPHFPFQGRNDRADRVEGQRASEPYGSRKDKAGAYREMIEVMDEGIGRIVQAVARLGISERTFIFFCSDNGAIQLGSNRPLRGFKGGLFEGGHRVPAIAYWPGKIEPGTITDETVLSMDLFPTMIRLADAEAPPDIRLDGVDFSSVLMENASLGQRTVFWRLWGQKVVRMGSWKLLLDRGRDGRRPEIVYLFNLADDPAEQHNLARAQPERVREMRAALEGWEREVA